MRPRTEGRDPQKCPLQNQQAAESGDPLLDPHSDEGGGTPRDNRPPVSGLV